VICTSQQRAALKGSPTMRVRETRAGNRLSPCIPALLSGFGLARARVLLLNGKTMRH